MSKLERRRNIMHYSKRLRMNYIEVSGSLCLGTKTLYGISRFPLCARARHVNCAYCLDYTHREGSFFSISFNMGQLWRSVCTLWVQFL